MSLKESKIKLLKKNYLYFDKLLNISNKIELNLNNYGYQNFNYNKFNLINIKSFNEKTFNFKLSEQYYNIVNNNTLDNYTNVYRYINNNIELLENTIKFYSKYIKNDILLNILIKDLKLNTEINNKFQFLESYDTYKILKDFY